MLRNLALIVLATLLVAGGALWMNGTPTATPGVVSVRVSFATAEERLQPNVVTTATKLGQGRIAVPGLPVTEAFVMPSLRQTDAGTALLISGKALPAVSKHQQLSLLPSAPSAQLRFDIYSWSMGTLVATTAEPISIGATHPDVPESLMTLARGAQQSQRVMLVLPPGAADLPAALNAHDAYVIIAEIRLSTDR